MKRVDNSNYYYVTTLEELNECYNYFVDKSCFGFDIETQGLIPREGKILSLQFGDYDTQYVIHVGSFKTEDFVKVFSLLTNPDKLVIGHNLKFEFKWLYYHYKIALLNIHDTMITEGLFHKGKIGYRLALDNTVQTYVDNVPDLDKNIRKKFIRKECSEHFTAEEILYSALDVKYLIDIYNGQLNVAKNYDMLDLMQLENNAVIPTAMLEHNGVYIDTDKWLALEEIAIEERKKAKNLLDSFFLNYNPSGDGGLQLELGLFTEKISKVNYNSHSQLKKALSWAIGEELPSTGEEVLMQYSHPAIKALLDYREHEKAVSTYGSTFLDKHLDKATKRIYSELNQTKAATGRYTSENPNQQSIKKEQEYRTPFCTSNPLERSVISADYSGCELRLIAELSGEPEWVKALKEGYDMHSYVASILFNIDYNELTENNKIKPEYKWLRAKAKAINFGVSYGMGAGRLGTNLGISLKEAINLLDLFWSKFPRIKRFLDKAIQKGLDDTRNYAYSPLDGRREWLYGLNKYIPKQRARMQNICKNFSFQCANASIIKRALYQVQMGFFAHPEWEGKLLLTIHDEIVVSYKSKYDDVVFKFITDEMVSAGEYYIKRVPVVVDVQIGKHWIH